MLRDAFALPADLQKFAGYIPDVDSHEMMPLQEWVPHFGEEVQPLVAAWQHKGLTADLDKNHPNVPSYSGDETPIDGDIVNIKGCLAPGAVLPKRRLEVMDAMGIESQLMFPGGVGLYGAILLTHEDDPHFLPSLRENRGVLARRWISLYQDWLIELARRSARIRPVAPVTGESVAEIMHTVTRLIDSGIRAIWLPAGLPLGGRSPAHSELDPFWSLLEEANCAVTLHIGGEGKLFNSMAWRDAEPFEGFINLGEFSVDPWSLSVLHLPFQNFLATMVTGGVFVRHPNLRFGVIEVGAHWLGPLMDTLDLWHKNLGFFNHNPHKLPELPSTYIRRNVRVSVFPFEPVDTYIERHRLEDVICFATDYPHVEGGKDIFKLMHDKIRRLGPEVVEKFFVKNGRWLLPNAPQSTLS